MLMYIHTEHLEQQAVRHTTTIHRHFTQSILNDVN